MTTPSVASDRPLRAGAEVVSIIPDTHLRRRFGVIPNVTVGRLLEETRDGGWLVDWGSGQAVRSDAYALRIGGVGADPCSQIAVDKVTGEASLIPNREQANPHRVVPDTLFVPQLTTWDFIQLADEAVTTGFTIVDLAVDLPEGTSETIAEELPELILDHIRRGQSAAAAATLALAHSIQIVGLTVERGTVKAEFTAAGEYFSVDATAFRRVFRAHWNRTYVTAEQKAVHESVPESRTSWFGSFLDSIAALFDRW